MGTEAPQFMGSQQSMIVQKMTAKRTDFSQVFASLSTVSSLGLYILDFLPIPLHLVLTLVNFETLTTSVKIFLS